MALVPEESFPELVGDVTDLPAAGAPALSLLGRLVGGPDEGPSAATARDALVDCWYETGRLPLASGIGALGLSFGAPPPARDSRASRCGRSRVVPAVVAARAMLPSLWVATTGGGAASSTSSVLLGGMVSGSTADPRCVCCWGSTYSTWTVRRLLSLEDLTCVAGAICSWGWCLAPSAPGACA